MFLSRKKPKPCNHDYEDINGYQLDDFIEYVKENIPEKWELELNKIEKNSCLPVAFQKKIEKASCSSPLRLPKIVITTITIKVDGESYHFDNDYSLGYPRDNRLPTMYFTKVCLKCEHCEDDRKEMLNKILNYINEAERKKEIKRERKRKAQFIWDTKCAKEMK